MAKRFLIHFFYASPCMEHHEVQEYSENEMNEVTKKLLSEKQWQTVELMKPADNYKLYPEKEFSMGQIVDGAGDTKVVIHRIE